MMLLGAQLRLPRINWPRARTMGALPRTAGHSTAMDSESAGER